MTNLDPAEIKVTSTFNLSLLTKQQLSELKFHTGKDMGEIISALVAQEHARLTESNPPVASVPRPFPTPANRPSAMIVGG